MFNINEIMLRNLGWHKTNYGFNYLIDNTLYVIDDNNQENNIKFIICESVTTYDNWCIPDESVIIAILKSNLELMSYIKKYNTWPVGHKRHFKLAKVLKK